MGTVSRSFLASPLGSPPLAPRSVLAVLPLPTVIKVTCAGAVEGAHLELVGGVGHVAVVGVLRLAVRRHHLREVCECVSRA